MNWRKRIVGYGEEAPDQLLANPANWRVHPLSQQEALSGVLDEIGWIQDVIVNRRTSTEWGADRGVETVVDGHLRVSLAISRGEKTIPIKYVDLDPREERLALIALDPISAQAGVDAAKLIELAGDDIDLTPFFDEDYLNTLMAAAKAENGGQDDGGAGDEPDPIQRADVPDAIWPSDNDLEIPLLDLALQADAVDAPVTTWGENSRMVKRHGGTYHFYTEDYRFEALWSDPSPVVNSGCLTVVEPNFSVYTDMPRAVAVWNVYRKRWIARYWQSKGLRILVDLNISARHYDLNLLGVPDGWKAYATRGYSSRIDQTDLEYEQALKKCQGTPLFVVYGGGDPVRLHCQARGWLWVPENRDIAKGKFQEYVNG